MRARALWFLGPGQVQVREEEVHRAPGGSVITSSLMGISHGTEMLVYRGQIPPGMTADLTIEALSHTTDYPVKYGYINVGVREDGRRVFAFFPHQDLFSLPSGQLVELPDGLEKEDAVFLAHMETAVSILHDASPLIGETALVLGQGTIGLLVSELLARSGTRVISVEPSKVRRQASERIGCTCLSPFDDPVVEEVLHLTEGRGADLAINVTGSDRALQTGIDSLGVESRLVEASWYGTRDARLSLGQSFHRRRLKLISSQVSTLAASLSARWDKARRMGLVIDLLKEVRPSRYISRSFSLDDASRAFELIDRNPEKVIQVVLTP